MSSFATIDVSVAHAGLFVAVALVAGARVGVDVEAVPTDFHDLVAAGAHPDERAGLTTAHRFAVHWVRKESILKAHGAGLRIDPATFVVPDPGSAPSRVVLPGEAPLTYRQHDLAVDTDHVGAVAVLTGSNVRFDVDDASDSLIASG